MQWTTDLIDRIGDALDESTVFGLTLDNASQVCRLLLEVDSLPEVGPLDALNEFFGSLTLTGAMYGWDFIDDDEDPTLKWADAPSLMLTLDARPAEHQLYWFTECSITGADEEFTRYFLQGLIRFRAVAVQRADGSTMSVAELVDDANRWWRAFREHDPRVTVEAQRTAGARAASWRTDRTSGPSTLTSGGERSSA
ncbi:hypothetical protein acdb102_39530 [Acidothermaceae bacterium B102]|nr:hypothetical protein acdb102_39530 [Acidothermaceae bacterium B102]